MIVSGLCSPVKLPIRNTALSTPDQVTKSRSAKAVKYSN